MSKANNKNRNVTAVILTALLCLSLTGCWSLVEIEDRAIVVALGIDKTPDNRMAVTMQVIKPAAIKSESSEEDSGGGNGAVLIYHSQGKDIFDALRKIDQTKGRRLYYTEMKVMVLGETLARDDISPAIDWLTRHPMINLRTLVMVSKNPAQEIITTKNPMEKIWALALNKTVRNDERLLAPPVDLLSFLRTSTSNRTNAPVLTYLELVGKEKPKDEENVAPGLEIVPSCRAVFRGCQMMGVLDATQTRGLLWVQDHISMGVITVPTPGSPDAPLTLAILKSRSKVKPTGTVNNLAIQVQIIEKSTIIEIGPEKININDPKVIETINRHKKAAIQQEIMAALNWAQSNRADIFGFGEAVRRKYPKEWPKLEKQWDEIFPTLDVAIEVQSQTRWTGLTSNPFHAKSEW